MIEVCVRDISSPIFSKVRTIIYFLRLNEGASNYVAFLGTELSLWEPTS